MSELLLELLNKRKQLNDAHDEQGEGISVHVSRHYDKQTAQREFMKGTGLAHQYGLVYAELYEKHLERQQHNICIDKLGELNVRVNRLTQEVHEMLENIRPR